MQPPELAEQLYLGTPLMLVEFGAVTPLLTCSLFNESVVARILGSLKVFAARHVHRREKPLRLFKRAAKRRGAEVNMLAPGGCVFVYLHDNRASQCKISRENLTKLFQAGGVYGLVA